MKKQTGVSTRPIFIPNRNNAGVMEKEVTFDWHMGMSAEVRKRSIRSLHEHAKKLGIKNILEASSKSEQDLGIALSAFNLKTSKNIAVENIFQSSKVFSKGGPYRDLLNVSPKEAKTDSRLKNSGEMTSFYFNGENYPLEPKSLFYDWLYLNILNSDQNAHLKKILIGNHYDGFSDIEFNPKKSFSCQARTLALCVSLYDNSAFDLFLQDPVTTAKELNLYSRIKFDDNQPIQATLF